MTPTPLISFLTAEITGIYQRSYQELDYQVPFHAYLPTQPKSVSFLSQYIF